MYAVIRTGGKQYKVAPNDVIGVEKLMGDKGAMVQSCDVLMVGGVGLAFFAYSVSRFRKSIAVSK